MSITSNAFDRLPGYAEHAAADQRIKDEIARNRASEFDAPINSADFADVALSGDEFPSDPPPPQRADPQRTLERGRSRRTAQERR